MPGFRPKRGKALVITVPIARSGLIHIPEGSTIGSNSLRPEGWRANVGVVAVLGEPVDKKCGINELKVGDVVLVRQYGGVENWSIDMAKQMAKDVAPVLAKQLLAQGETEKAASLTNDDKFENFVRVAIPVNASEDLLAVLPDGIPQPGQVM